MANGVGRRPSSVEYAPPKRRGIIGSYQQAATALGLLLATFVAYLLTAAMDPAAFTAWGWRIAFLIGFVLGPIGYYLRTRSRRRRRLSGPYPSRK